MLMQGPGRAERMEAIREKGYLPPREHLIEQDVQASGVSRAGGGVDVFRGETKQSRTGEQVSAATWLYARPAVSPR